MSVLRSWIATAGNHDCQTLTPNPTGDPDVLESDLTATMSGGDVVLTYTVRNEGEESKTITVRSGKVATVSVMAGDQAIWRSDEGQMHTQAIRELTIDPDEDVSKTVRWEAPDPGRYIAKAELDAATPLTAETAFKIEE